MPAKADLATAAESLSAVYRDAGASISTTEEEQVLAAKGFLKCLTRPLLSQMGISEATTMTTPLYMLDMACGTGVVTQELQVMLSGDVLKESKLLAADSSAALVELCRKRIAAEGWVNTEARVLDAMDTGLPSDAFSHVSIAMGLHLIQRPDDALQECIRVLKPGGILGVTTPHDDPTHSMWQPDVRSAFASFPFEAPFPERFPSQMHDHGRWADPAWVESRLRGLGLADVEARVVRGSYRVESAEHFLRVFWGMLGWVVSAWWGEEARAAHPLEEIRELVRMHLEEKYAGEGWDVLWAVVVATGKVA